MADCWLPDFFMDSRARRGSVSRMARPMPYERERLAELLPRRDLRGSWRYAAQSLGMSRRMAWNFSRRSSSPVISICRIIWRTICFMRGARPWLSTRCNSLMAAILLRCPSTQLFMLKSSRWVMRPSQSQSSSTTSSTLRPSVPRIRRLPVASPLR